LNQKITPLGIPFRFNQISSRSSRKKRRFPAEQFSENGSIIPAIDRLVSIIGTHGETWNFLTQQSASLNGKRPIDLLKAGKVERVLKTAERNYDVENWQ
jgi:uncharacterized protein (DUF2384 family)